MDKEKFKTRKGELYRSPFVTRWAGEQMLRIWGDINRFTLWRKLWIALAESQQELGLAISDEAIKQLKEKEKDIDLDLAAEYEKKLRHDVMAHVSVYGDQCPEARGIIHLGATSCFVADNSELILIRESFGALIPLLAKACKQLSEFALRYQHLPCLAYTHYQPAQVTTVGKRSCLWLQDLLWDLENMVSLTQEMPFRGAKGTTGSQASFLHLFNGEAEKVKELDRRVAKKMGFHNIYPVTGQTYPRKFDWQVLSSLCGIAISSQKAATDIRLLAGMKEIEEPFGKQQIGSSVMAYKRNPMRCERICALSRFVINNAQNAAFTAAEQWMERTLDDSANRRLALPEGFLATDSIVRLLVNITQGLVVNNAIISRRLEAELPFMATENILMEAVKAGGDRQDLHERIRLHSMDAAQKIKQTGNPENDLIGRLAADPAFACIKERFEEILDPGAFVGRAPDQVQEFISSTVTPVLDKINTGFKEEVELRV